MPIGEDNMVGNNKRLHRGMLVSLLVFIFGGMIAHGTEPSQGNWIHIAEDQVISGDFIRGANRVSSQGRVTGDFIFGANEVSQEGIIEGDFIGAGAQAKIGGVIKGNIRTIGKDIDVTGEVNRNASIFASNLYLQDGAVIDGSIHVFAGYMDLGGLVGGDIRGAVGTAVFRGNVKGDVYLHVDKIYFEPGATIEGNLTYTSSKPYSIDPARVKGTIQHQYSDSISFQEGLKELRVGLRRISIFLKGLFLLSYIIIGLLIVRFIQHPVNQAVEILNEKPWLSLGLGAGLLVGIPIIAVLLLISIIGIPIGILLMTFYGLLIYLAKIPIEIWLGKKILREHNQPYLPFIIGSILIASLRLIPYFGWWITGVVIAFGIGATLMMIKHYYQINQKKSIE